MKGEVGEGEEMAWRKQRQSESERKVERGREKAHLVSAVMYYVSKWADQQEKPYEEVCCLCVCAFVFHVYKKALEIKTTQQPWHFISQKQES